MSVERTRELALGFAHQPEARLLAENAVFVFAELSEEEGATDGREVRGRAAVARALAHFYGGEGTTRTVASPVAVADGRAMVQVGFFGRDLGRFFGLATADEPVLVPCEMVLTVAGDRIATGYLAFDLGALRRTVGTVPV
jgi:hypothetical protein